MHGPVKISVITPSFNQAQFIERTIRSVLEQHLSFLMEYIVVDGGSTDATLAILDKYKGRLKCLSERDRGQSDAVNKGIAMASGEIIGWLNSDDVYLPRTLQRVVDLFEANPARQWLFGKCLMIDKDDRPARSWITAYKDYSCRHFSYANLLTENFISQPAVFFRKAAFLNTGPLDLDQHYAMDYDLWLRMSRLGYPLFVDEYLASFRIQGASKSLSNFRRLFVEQYEIQKKYDQRWYILFIHRVKIQTILLIYRAMEVLG
jgi:glycosyltransferase involved in cell wall biosynthesis